MGRVVAAQKVFLRLAQPQVTPTELPLRKIEDACRKVHRECMSLVSLHISSEVEPGDASAEDMALILGCAQTAQTAATLARLESRQLTSLMSACTELCNSCLRHSFSTLRPEVYLNLQIACREALSVLI